MTFGSSRAHRNVKAPKVSLEGGGIFRTIEVNRQVLMKKMAARAGRGIHPFPLPDKTRVPCGRFCRRRARLRRLVPL
jgi:hypothetical protein